MGAQVSPAAETIIGLNWGSTNFRAWLIGEGATALDEVVEPAGVVGLGRDGMVKLIEHIRERWPQHLPVYASGMIGSNIGWTSVPYAEAPAGAAGIKAAGLTTSIGKVPVHILPGVACQRRDGSPDVLRGEEVELLGLARLRGEDGLVVLPGTHTKWAWLEGGCIGEFFTSMSGEIYDRLTEKGLLASIVDGNAKDGPAFREGVLTGRKRQLGLGTLLFGARARVMRDDLTRADAASYLRGLLIGAEIGDAFELYAPHSTRPIPLVGNAALCTLYAAALETVGLAAIIVESRLACLTGFRALHEASNG